MTIIVPELHAALQDQSSQPPTKLGLPDNSYDTNTDLSPPLHQSTSLKSALKTTNSSISLVISKTKTSSNEDSIDGDDVAKDSVLPVAASSVKVVSRGRRRSVDKQYRPSQPTGNNGGGGRTSSRRSGRSYQNYDNNSSNGNSGADGNGEDNDDSDDDDDDEYIDDDDDDEEEEDEEEEDEEEDKNEEEEDDENRQDKNNDNSIDENVLASFGLKVPGESSVVLENSQTNENSLAQVPPGTPVTLQGIICHETTGGVLVVNIKWRNNIYCGSLMDCSRHSWARPRFQSMDGSTHQGKTRMGKNSGRGKGKGKGKRLRSNSVTSTNSTNHTVSPLKQKLRGRKKTISGSSVEKRQGFRCSKRKPKNDDDSDDASRPGKRNCTGKGAPSPQPSPTLIECPEPGCEKKYKHINGLRYHQAHAHLESKNQDDDNNSDDRSSTTPSPSEEFKEPDPLTTAKNRVTNVTTRSSSESVTSVISSDKEPATTDNTTINNTDTDDNQENNMEHESKLCEEILDKCVENTQEVTTQDECKDEEDSSNDKLNVSNDGEFVEVADKSTDTQTTTSYSCTKHATVAMDTVVPDNELPEVADTQEVWETVLDSGCVTSSVISNVTKQQESGKETGQKDGEGQQVLITTSGINQLGIEVEDISENEEDIDPGQDVEFNSREEMEKAVENLQSGSFVTSLSTENNLQMLSSLKDPSLIFGLTNRERMLDDKGTRDASPEPMTSENTDNTTNTLSDSKTQSNITVSCSISVETLVSRSITASKHEPPLTNADTPSSRFKYFSCRSYGDETYAETASNISTNNTVTTLALIRDPEWIKKDTASNSSLVNTNGLESSVESVGPSYTGSMGFNQDCTTSSIHSVGPSYTGSMGFNQDCMTSSIHSVGPSYTGSMGFNQDCMTSSIHSYGPKEELKEQSTSGDVTSHGPTLPNDRHSLASHHSVSSLFSSPKSSTSTTFNTKLQSSHIETTSISKDTKSRTLEKDGNVEEEKDNDKKPLTEGTGEDEDSNKSSVVFVRQPSTLILKHSRPPVGVAHPYQHSNVAATNLTTTGLCVTSSSHKGPCPTESAHNTFTKTDEVESRILPKMVSDKYPTIPVGEVDSRVLPKMVSDKYPTIPVGEVDSRVLPKMVSDKYPTIPVGEVDSRVLPKMVSDKYPTIPVGEVGPVNVKRPAIHAGLPTVIPVGAPSLKTAGQGSLHVPFRQGLKPPAGQEDRSSTPGSLRMASSPRSITSSPRPLSTSPKLSPKTSISETKAIPPKPTPSKSSSSSKPSDSTDDTDVVIVKEEKECKGVSSDTDRERKPYEPPKEQHPTTEQIQLYQFHQRQMLQLAQAGIDPIVQYAYLRNFGYDISSLTSPWPLNMSPEHMKLLQQQRIRAEEQQRIRAEEQQRIRAEEQQRIRAEEGRMELHASKSSKEESSKVKLEKRESSSPHEGRPVPEATRHADRTSTPPRLERQRLMLDLSPGEGSRSVTGESGSRGVPCVEPPEKKSKVEFTGKSDDTDRELQKLRHKRQEEYLSKQSMQHKFAMFKQLESTGGAAKTHSIPPLIDGSKRDEDYQKSKYSPHSTHSDSLNQASDKGRKYPATTDPDDVSQSSSPRSREPKAKHVRERPSFIPTQFQEYLQHSQMLDQMNYDPSTGKPVSLIPGQIPAGLDSVSSRIKDSSSPYKSPSSPRPSRPRSPSKSSSPVPISRAPPHRTSEASRSPYKSIADKQSTSPSISNPIRSSTARTSYRSTSPSTSYGSHSDSSHVYRVPTSSPSRGTIFSRADKPRSPLHHTDPRHNPRPDVYSKESSSRSVVKDGSPKTSSHQEDVASSKHGAVYRSQERQKEVDGSAARPGIISNNLALRRGDVTASMLMPAYGPPDEELLRRHSYLMYSPYSSRMMEHRQQQHEQVYAAMMSSAQQNTSRTDQYYGKRQ